MLTYTVDGQILTIVSTGTTPAAERQQFYSSIQSDDRVQQRSLLLIDARRADPAKSVQELSDRAHLIASLLGSKMGPLCAVIAPPRLTNDAVYFQAATGALGVRVGIFNDEPEALTWLRGFAGQR